MWYTLVHCYFTFGKYSLPLHVRAGLNSCMVEWFNRKKGYGK